jgi:hypothetical protein
MWGGEEEMPAPTDEDIRKRACLLWKSAGEPNGNPNDFWYQAEKEILKDKRWAMCRLA